MITKFKIFENLNEGKPQVGDWVIAYDDMYPFLKFSPGQIEKIEPPVYYIHFYDLVFSDGVTPYNPVDIPIISYTIKDIKYWSKNKTDIDMILATRKYNL